MSARYLWLAGISIAALLLRFALMPDQGLWYDELQSVAYAAQSPLGVVDNVLAFDPHPPLYYLLLHAWMAVSASDAALFSFSILLGTAAVGSLYWLGAQIFDARTGMLAAALLAVSPIAVHFSLQVRMYAWLMLLTPWVVYFGARLFGAARGSGVAYIVLMLAGAYSHGAGFLLVVAGAAYTFGLAVRDGGCNARVQRWFGIHGLIAVLYLPWLVRAYGIREFIGDAFRADDLHSAAQPLAELLGGFAGDGVIAAPVLGVSLLALLGVVAWRDHESRPLVLGFVAPLITALLLSWMLQPIWFVRSVAFLAPIAMLLVARGITLLAGRRWPVVAVAVWLGLSVALVIQERSTSRTEQTMPLVTYLKPRLEPGDQIVAPNVRVAWGVAWYLLGKERLHDLAEVSIRFGDDQRLVSRAQPGATRFWVVLRNSDRLKLPLPPVEERAFSGFRLLRLEVPRRS